MAREPEFAELIRGDVMRLMVVLFASLLLSSCFVSRDTLLDEGAAMSPIADGAGYAWTFENGEQWAVTYHANARAYDVETQPDGYRFRMVFFEVPATPERDFIVQATNELYEPLTSYGFAWPRGDGTYSLILGANSIIPMNGGIAELRRRCSQVNELFASCTVRDGTSLEALYLRFIYPRYVVGRETPRDLTIQSPKVQR